MLCTVDDVKLLIERTDTDDDALIQTMASLASQWLAIHVGRTDGDTGASLIEAFTGRVERHDGGESFVSLAGFPIIDNQTLEVVEAATIGGLATATALVKDEDYYLEGSRVWRLSSSGRQRPFLGRLGCVRVTYDGGWHPADSQDPLPTGWSDVPAANRQAAALLAKHLFQNKDHFGQRSFHVGTATIDTVVRDLGVVEVIRDAFQALKFVGIG